MSYKLKGLSAEQLEKLPKAISDEIATLKSDSDNYDAELYDIFKENDADLHELAMKNLGSKGEPKKKPARKAPARKAPAKVDGSKFGLGEKAYLLDGSGPFEVTEIVSCKRGKGNWSRHAYMLEGKEGEFKPSELRKTKPEVKEPAPEKKQPEQKGDDELTVEQIFETVNSKSDIKAIVKAGKQLNAKRAEESIIADAVQDNKRRLYPNFSNLKRWWRNPDNFDLIGVDNFEQFDPTVYTKELNKAKIMNLINL